MCGIIAYCGTDNATDILLKGLKRLEYRGYDSAGIALIQENNAMTFKAKGAPDNLIQKIEEQKKNNQEDVQYFLNATVGLGHTRWATHGEASEKNAHPHFSNDRSLLGVHNGTIENNRPLKKKLLDRGYTFTSDTDTEVLINFIHWIKVDNNLSLLDAVQVAWPQITGTCVLVLYSLEERCLIAINKGGQLCSGKSDKGYYVASDTVAFVGMAKNTMDIGNEQILFIERGRDPQLLDLELNQLEIITSKISIDIEDISLGNWPHFMIKEIFSQPDVVTRALQGRFNFQDMSFRFGGLDHYWEKIKHLNQLTIVACGTSWHAGLLGKYWLERLANMSVKVEYASEFDPCVINPKDVVIGISQSGNTADTIHALELAKEKGATTIGIVNTVDSTIAKLTDAGVYTRAGVEIGVASTKAFIAQAVVFLLLALKLAKERGTITAGRLRKIVDYLEILPNQIKKVLKLSNDIKLIAEKYKEAKNFLYLGKDFNFPIALEGALKLKEISYIHAEGMSLGEMKHGVIALIDEHMPVVMIVTQGNNYDRILSNLAEIKSRAGNIIALVSGDDKKVSQEAAEVINLPEVDEVIAPLTNVVALQLLSYHLANERGCDIDKPRNLAKSVTVH